MEKAGWEGKRSSLEGFSLPGQLDKAPYTNFAVRSKFTFRTGNRAGEDKGKTTSSFYLIARR